jgi:hypothetical protein
MNIQYGKYKVFEDDKTFEIHYRYSISDIFGSIIYILFLAVGLLGLYVSLKSFNATTITSWLIFIFGLGFLIIGAYAMISALYRPKRGIFQIDKTINEIVVREFLKTERINTNEVKSVSYVIKDNSKPKSIYAMLHLNLRNGKKLDCFIVRSAIPFDLGREVEKDIHSVSKQLRDVIMRAI